MIISVLNNEWGYGFFSSLFFMVNHYLYCIKNRKNFPYK